MKLIFYVILLFTSLFAYSQTAFIQVNLYKSPLDSIAMEFYNGSITSNPTRIVVRLEESHEVGYKITNVKVQIFKETVLFRVLVNEIPQKLNRIFYIQPNDSIFIEAESDALVDATYKLNLVGNQTTAAKNKYMTAFAIQDGNLFFKYLSLNENQFIDALALFMKKEYFILDSLEKTQILSGDFIQQRRNFLSSYINGKKFSFALENAIVHEQKYIKFLPYFHYDWLSLDSTKNKYLLEETSKMLYIENRDKSKQFTTDIFSSNTAIRKKAFIKYFSKVPTLFEFEETYCERMDTLIDIFFHGENKIYLKAKLVFFALEQNTKTSNLLYEKFLHKYPLHQYTQELTTYITKLHKNTPTLIKSNSKNITRINLSDLEEMCLDLKGNKFDAKSIKDKILIIDFWATWCRPCIESMPFMEKLAMDFSDNSNLQFIYLSLDDNIEAWQRMVTKKELKGLSLLSIGGFKSKIAQYFKIDAIPYYLVIDQKGNIVYKGNANKEKLANFLAKMQQIK